MLGRLLVVLMEKSGRSANSAQLVHMAGSSSIALCAEVVPTRKSSVILPDFAGNCRGVDLYGFMLICIDSYRFVWISLVLYGV